MATLTALDAAVPRSAPGGFGRERLALSRDDVHQDPYPYYRWLQEQGPCVKIGGLWVVSHFEQVNALLRDRRLGADMRKAKRPLLTGELELPLEPAEEEPEQHAVRDWLAARLSAPLGPVERRIVEWAAEKSMIGIDGAGHKRQRRIVADAFTPKAVAALEPAVRQRARDLLDQAGRRFDAISQLGFPLPLGVIADLLDVPTDQQFRMRTWSSALTRATDPTISGAHRRRAAWAAFAFGSYVMSEIPKRRGSGRDDLLTRLIDASEGDDELTTMEMVGNVILLLVAGHETSTNLIGNGIYALLRHPEQYERLIADPGLVEATVEETLRYDSPGQLTYRTALEPVEVEGAKVGAGEQLMLLTGAANSDPRAFDDPRSFDITRERRSHIAFGAGPHFCLGAPLARLEGRVVFEELLERGRLRLAGAAPRYRANIAHRGLVRLDVRVS